MLNKVITIVLSALLLLGLNSCSPEKRLARLLRNNPQLVKSDTIWTIDSIYTKGVLKDSVFNYFQTDTILLKQDKLTIKYYYNHDSTIYLQGQCAPDTIYKYYPSEINTITPPAELTFWQKVKLWIWSNGWWVALLIWLIWRIFGRIIKSYFPFLSRIGPKP